MAITHARFRRHWAPVDRGVSLRVFSWTPLAGPTGPPIVFVPGWVSVVEGWKDLLHVLTRRHPLVYVETREKQSARFEGRRLRSRDFRIERFAHDLLAVCRHLAVPMEETLYSGSSLGATVILEALKYERLPAKGAFLIGPTCEFHIPLLLRWLPYLLPAFTYHVMKHFVVWYFRHFRVNVEREPEQMRRYEQTILSAHPLRIKLSARAFMHYKVWPDLETVRAPVGIAYAPTDKLHDRAEIVRMGELLSRSSLVPCESNRYMHSAALEREIERFIAGLDGEESGRTVGNRVPHPSTRPGAPIPTAGPGRAERQEGP